jgi:hypothetical protein
VNVTVDIGVAVAISVRMITDQEKRWPLDLKPLTMRQLRAGSGCPVAVAFGTEGEGLEQVGRRGYLDGLALLVMDIARAEDFHTEQTFVKVKTPTE